MRKLVAAIIVTLFLASMVSIVEAQYDVTVNAVGDSTTLHVPIFWSWNGYYGIKRTPFTRTGVSGDLKLAAPPIHIESYTFYIFDYWDLDGAPQTQGVKTVTISASSPAAAATAHYKTVLSVSKVKTGFDPVPVGAPADFAMTITVHAYDDVTLATVVDSIPAKLAVVSTNPPVPYWKLGSTGPTVVRWNIGPLTSGNDYILDINVHTGGFTRTGTHYLNSGPVVYFTYLGKQYLLKGPPVTVNVVVGGED